MKLLPIEEGCRAIVHSYSSELDGTTVNVIAFIGRVGLHDGVCCVGNDRWITDKKIFTLNLDGSINTAVNHVRECYLMRIDGNEDLFKSEEDNKVLEISNDN